MYVAKQQEQHIQNNGYYELFNQVEVIDDMTLEVVGTKNQSIGSYSLEWLEQEKEQATKNYIDYVAEIDKKITSIKSIIE